MSKVSLLRLMLPSLGLEASNFPPLVLKPSTQTHTASISHHYYDEQDMSFKMMPSMPLAHPCFVQKHNTQHA